MLWGSGVGVAKIVLRKCVVSFMYEGINGTSGLRTLSMKMESFSVGESHPEMIGLPCMQVC